MHDLVNLFLTALSEAALEWAGEPLQLHVLLRGREQVRPGKKCPAFDPQRRKPNRISENCKPQGLPTFVENRKTTDPARHCLAGRDDRQRSKGVGNVRDPPKAMRLPFPSKRTRHAAASIENRSLTSPKNPENNPVHRLPLGRQHPPVAVGGPQVPNSPAFFGVLLCVGVHGSAALACAVIVFLLLGLAHGVGS